MSDEAKPNRREGERPAGKTLWAELTRLALAERWPIDPELLADAHRKAVEIRRSRRRKGKSA